MLATIEVKSCVVTLNFCVRDRSKQQLLSTFIYLGDVVETMRSGENVLVGKKDHNKVRASSMSINSVVLQDLTRNPG